MASATGLTIVKRFPYRTNTVEEWSNTYWLTGPAPASAAGWRTLFDQIVTLEKPMYSSVVQVIKGYGYDDNRLVNPAAVWSVDLRNSPDTPVAGTNSATAAKYAGDAAVWIRWLTPVLTSQGKKRYVRKYYHDIFTSATATPDTMNTAQRTTFQTFADAMIGTNTTGRKIANRNDPNTACTATTVAPFVTTRTLKRRPKRLPT